LRRSSRSIGVAAPVGLLERSRSADEIPAGGEEDAKPEGRGCMTGGISNPVRVLGAGEVTAAF